MWRASRDAENNNYNYDAIYRWWQALNIGSDSSFSKEVGVRCLDRIVATSRALPVHLVIPHFYFSWNIKAPAALHWVKVSRRAEKAKKRAERWGAVAKRRELYKSVRRETLKYGFLTGRGPHAARRTARGMKTPGDTTMTRSRRFVV